MNRNLPTKTVDTIKIYAPLHLVCEGEITQLDHDKLGLNRNVMEEYPHQDGMRDKVEAVHINTETLNGTPMCVAECKLNASLTSDEYRKLVEFSSDRMKETFTPQTPELNMELGGM